MAQFHAHYVQTGIVADTTSTTVLAFPLSPCGKFTVQVNRTAGSQDVVDVDLYGSLDGTNLTKIADVVTSVSGGFNQGSVVDKPQLYVKVVVATVGSGNTLTVIILGQT